MTAGINNLIEISNFSASGASRDLLAQVKQQITEIDGHRPLKNEVVQKLNEQILFDRVHSSAVTEGNRLSKRETISVLMHGVVESGSRKDIQEVKNLSEAIFEIDAVLRSGEGLSKNNIRQLHSILMREIDDYTAGSYRSENVRISGAEVQPPHFQDVPDAIDVIVSCIDEYFGEYDPVELASWAHWAMARVHPFKDGNGRIARLVQDYVLLRGHCVPAPLRGEDRDSSSVDVGAYYTALEAADHGNGQPLLEIVAKNTLRMADRYLTIIRQENEKNRFVQSLARVATEKVKHTSHRKFIQVQRSFNLLKDEFSSLANELDENIDQVRVNFRDYGTIDFEKYQKLEKHGRAERTWLFGIEVRLEDTRIRFIFWAGKHLERSTDIAVSHPSDVVALVSMEAESRYYKLLDEIQEEHISVRELIPDGPVFWRRRYNPVTQEEEWDTDVHPSEIAQDFFSEVFGKLGLR